MNQQEKNIINTIAYFDIFSYPLTPLEIYQWLWSRPADDLSLTQIIRLLDHSEILRQKISCRQGLYFLKNREIILSPRRINGLASGKKFRKAVTMGRWLAYLPFISAIGLSNKLAYNNSGPDGDIDLFIITVPGRIWTARFFLNLFLKIINARPRAGNKRDKFCTAFIIDEKQTDLSDLLIGDDDIHFYYWLAQVYPLYGQAKIHKLLIQNSWLWQKLSPASLISQISSRRIEPNKSIKRLGEMLVSIITEDYYRKIQMRILPISIKNQANQGKKVVLRDGLLKFHLGDRRQFYLDEYNKRIANYETA